VSLVSRSIVAGATGFALMGLAACGGGASGGGTTTPSQPTGLASLDPCKIATPQQLTADGLQTQGTVNNDIPQQPGCGYKGSSGSGLRVTFTKNQTETVDKFEHDVQWADFTKPSINGRKAARAQGADVKGNGGCTALMDAGGGAVLVEVTDVDKSDDQVCSEAMKYAQQVEPTLPK
jgi:hypothetical protein